MDIFERGAVVLDVQVVEDVEAGHHVKAAVQERQGADRGAGEPGQAALLGKREGFGGEVDAGDAAERLR